MARKPEPAAEAATQGAEQAPADAAAPAAAEVTGTAPLAAEAPLPAPAANVVAARDASEVMKITVVSPIDDGVRHEIGETMLVSPAVARELVAAGAAAYAAAMPGGGRLAASGALLLSADQATAGFDGNSDQRRLLSERIGSVQRGLSVLDPNSQEAVRYREVITQLQSQLAALDTPLERSARALRDQGEAFAQAAGAARTLAEAEIRARNTARERGSDEVETQRLIAEARAQAQVVLDGAFNDGMLARERELESQRRQIEASRQGAAAVEREAIAFQARAAALRTAPAGSAAYNNQVRLLTDAETERVSNPRISNLLVDQAQQRDRQALDNELIGASATERAQRTAALRERQRLGVGAETPEGRNAIAGARELAANQVELERTQAAYNEIGRVGEQAFDRIGQAITSGTLTLKDLGRIGQSVASELSQAFLRLAVINPLKNLAGGNAPTLGDVGGILNKLLVGGGGDKIVPSIAEIATPGFFATFHSGGIAGGTPTAFAAMDPAIFIGAPRFHDGGVLAPDEVPAILQRGEGVFTAEQMAALGRGDHLSATGGGNTISIHMPVNFSGDSGSETDRMALLAQMRAQTVAVVAELMPNIARTSHAYTMGEISRGGNAARMVGRR